MSAVIQVKRGLAASWVSGNPVLVAGEFGYETDTGKLKLGDGTTQWNDLGYLPSAAARGAANGYASLDSGGKVPVAQLPSSIMEYQGVWNASTNSPTLADGTGNTGDVYRVGTAGTRNLGSGSITFDVGDYVIYNGSTWEKSDTTDAVSTVNTYTGNVTQDQITGLSSTGIVKRTGTNTLAIAASGSDYAPATSGSSILKGNGSGGFSAASAGTDYVAPGGALGTPVSGDVSACVGQVADMSIVAFGTNTARAANSYGDFPFGVKLQRPITFSSVTFRVFTADASGNLVVELRKNGAQVSGTSTTIAAANQVAGGTSTGTWAFAAGDILTVYVTGVGTTPGKGLCADIKGLTTT